MKNQSTRTEQRKLSQRNLILNYLNKGKILTTHKAITKLGVYSLSARISELIKNEKAPIQKRRVNTKSRKNIIQYYIF